MNSSNSPSYGTSLFSGLDLNEQTGLPSTNEPKRPLLEHHSDHDFILRIDNSLLETFQTCSRSAYYYAIARRQRQPSPALAFGGAVHVALEHIYRHGYDQSAEAIYLASEHYAKSITLPPDEWRTPSLLVDLCESYVKTYRANDEIVLLVTDSTRWVEIPFSLELGTIEIDSTVPFTYEELTDNSDSTDCGDHVYIRNLHILWSGRIDVAGYYGTPELFVIDHKTTSIAGPQFFQDFMLSQQMVGYNWALRKLTNLPVLGVIVNAIICRKPTKTGKGIEFARETYFHQDWHVNEWQADVMHEVERFVYSLTQNSWPKLTKWCFGKYGRCPYHDVCTLPPGQRSIMLSTPEFANVTWSPLADR